MGPKAGAFMVLLLALLVAMATNVTPVSAAVSMPAFPVAADGLDNSSPAISGSKVVWIGGGSHVYFKNLSGTGPAIPLPDDPALQPVNAPQSAPAISGNVVVWEENDGSDWNIYGYDVSTLPAGKPFQIAAGAGDQRRPDVSGDTVVWEDNSSGNWDVYRKDLGGQAQPVAAGDATQRKPAISGGKVVWQYQTSPGNADIYFKDLASGAPALRITADPEWQEAPDISGNTVVWRDERIPGNLDIYAYDLAEKREFRVTDSPADQWAPAISGRVVVWADNRNPMGSDIYGEDISTGEEFAVTTSSASQDSPAIDGETAVWEAQRDGADLGVYDIYGADLDTAPAAPAGLAATPSAGGIKLAWTASPELDLAGYNVYRSSAADGEYTKLNPALLTTPSYMDPDAPKGVRSYYRVTAVDQPQGSESAPARLSAVAPKPTEISLSTSPTTLTYNGGTTTLSGTLASGADPLANRTVVLEQKPDGGSWAAVANGRLATAGNGGFALAGVKVDRDTEYRARFASAEEELQSSTSPTAAVDVKMLVSVSTSTKYVKLGRSVGIYGTVMPALTGTVKLTITRNGAVLSKQSVPLNSSRYSMPYKPRTAGVYYVTATFGNEISSGTTNTAKFTVRR